MTTDSTTSDLESRLVGEAMYELAEELYPICRSISGNGVRDTLRIIKRHIPLEIVEVPTGTKAFDWSVPKEWNIRDAYVKNANGERVIDFQSSNLHVMSYSAPVRERMSLSELKSHCLTLKDHPDWIPYRTSYYRERWGFCLSQRQLDALNEQHYDVCIDSTLEDGSLTYGECFIEGRTSDEILLSCHVCHPSLCNDNLSGIALATFLSKSLISAPRRYSYRILFTPGLIGSITWLSRNEHHVDRIKHGLILACVGDAGRVTYKRSRLGNAEIDRATAYVLRRSGDDHELRDFSPYGYDERQFCSPGFNLPMGCFMRTPHGEFPEYHASADDLSFIHPEHLADSFRKCIAILGLLEANMRYVNQNPKCEPQLGRRGLYGTIGGDHEGKEKELALLWVLNQSDGTQTLLDITERSELDFSVIKWAADGLLDHGLLKETGP